MGNIIEALQVISHHLWGLSIEIRDSDNRENVINVLDIAIRALCDLRLLVGGNSAKG